MQAVARMPARSSSSTTPSRSTRRWAAIACVSLSLVTDPTPPFWNAVHSKAE
jgi:hypothetical protein